MCAFLSLAVGPIDAADNSFEQPKQRGRLKNPFNRKQAVKHQQVLSSIAESPQHARVADGGLDLDHKHNGSFVVQSSSSSKPGEPTAFPNIRPSSVHPMWLSNSNYAEQPSPKTPKSRQQLTINPAVSPSSTFAQAEDDDCDTQFVQPSSVNTFFKHFLSKLLSHERKEYEDLYSLKATSSLKAQNKSDYKAFCRAQTVLRRAVAVAYGLTSEQNEKCRQDIARCHSAVADGRKALEQEKEAFEAMRQQKSTEFEQTMEQKRQEIASQVAQARTLLDQERNAWNQQVAQDKITAKRRRYALLGACAISLGGVGLAWISLVKNKPAQATAA